MSQIKVTVSEDEKRQIESEAAAANLTASKYLRNIWLRRKEKVYEEDLTIPEGNSETVRVKIPKALNESLKETARKNGMTKTAYINLLLSQKGRPVEIKADLPSRYMYTQRINNLLNEVETISSIASRSGFLYETELSAVIKDLRAAAKEFMKEAGKRDRVFTEDLDVIRSEISHIKGFSNGNRENDTDS